MAPVGRYAKGVAKRDEIVEVALRIVAEHGYDSATIRRLADAVGLSKTGLLHHFESKEELFTEILRRRDAVAAADYRREHGEGEGRIADPAGTAVDFVRHNTAITGFVELYVRFCAEATERDHPAHGYFARRYDRSEAMLAEAERELQEAGRLPAELDVDRMAVIVAALIDGLQVRSMFDPSVDVAEHVGYLIGLLARPAPGADG